MIKGKTNLKVIIESFLFTSKFLSKLLFLAYLLPLSSVNHHYYAFNDLISHLLEWGKNEYLRPSKTLIFDVSIQTLMNFLTLCLIEKIICIKKFLFFHDHLINFHLFFDFWFFIWWLILLFSLSCYLEYVFQSNFILVLLHHNLFVIEMDSFSVLNNKIQNVKDISIPDSFELIGIVKFYPNIHSSSKHSKEFNSHNFE